MQKKMVRIMAVAAVVLLLSLVLAGAAGADDSAVEPEGLVEEESDLNGDAGHMCDGVEFSTVVTGAEGTLSDGGYYLDADVTLSSDLSIAADSAVKICLNGFDLNSGSYTLHIPATSTLAVYNCKDTGGISGTVGNSGTVTAMNGSVLENVLSLGGISGRVSIGKDTTIANNPVVNSNVTLTVPSGTTLTVNGSLTSSNVIEDYGTITGTVINNGTIAVKTETELLKAVGFSGTDSRVRIDDDVGLTNEFSVDSGRTLIVPESRTLTVPSGTTLSVNGSLEIRGTADVNGTFTPAASTLSLNGSAAVLDLRDTTYTWESIKGTISSGTAGAKVILEDRSWKFIHDYPGYSSNITDCVSGDISYTFTIPATAGLKSSTGGITAYPVGITLTTPVTGKQLVLTLESDADTTHEETPSYTLFAVNKGDTGYKAYYKVGLVSGSDITPLKGTNSTSDPKGNVVLTKDMSTTDPVSGSLGFKTIELPLITGTYTGTLVFRISVESTG